MNDPQNFQRGLSELFHELSPRRRMNVMRNTMGVISRRVRKQVVADLKGLSYTPAPRHKGEQRKRSGHKKLAPNVVAVSYRRAVGFHVTIASRRPASKGSHTKFDHLNRWNRQNGRDRWVPAIMWLNGGTKRQPARPFMEKAASQMAQYERQIAQVFEEKLDKALKKHYDKL